MGDEHVDGLEFRRLREKFRHYHLRSHYLYFVIREVENLPSKVSALGFVADGLRQPSKLVRVVGDGRRLSVEGGRCHRRKTI